MDSKHGGSEASGLVLPIGLEALRPATPAGMVLVPQEVVDARKQAEERKARAHQLERRRIALEMFGTSYTPLSPSSDDTRVALALRHADELIAATGGGI
jgi:hypothetical protein